MDNLKKIEKLKNAFNIYRGIGDGRIKKIKPYYNFRLSKKGYHILIARDNNFDRLLLKVVKKLNL